MALAEISHGLLIEETDCRELTRSVSFEVAQFEEKSVEGLEIEA